MSRTPPTETTPKANSRRAHDDDTFDRSVDPSASASPQSRSLAASVQPSQPPRTTADRGGGASTGQHIKDDSQHGVSRDDLKHRAAYDRGGGSDRPAAGTGTGTGSRPRVGGGGGGGNASTMASPVSPRNRRGRGKDTEKDLAATSETVRPSVLPLSMTDVLSAHSRLRHPTHAPSDRPLPASAPWVVTPLIPHRLALPPSSPPRHHVSSNIVDANASTSSHIQDQNQSPQNGASGGGGGGASTLPPISSQTPRSGGGHGRRGDGGGDATPPTPSSRRGTPRHSTPSNSQLPPQRHPQFPQTARAGGSSRTSLQGSRRESVRGSAPPRSNSFAGANPRRISAPQSRDTPSPMTQPPTAAGASTALPQSPMAAAPPAHMFSGARDGGGGALSTEDITMMNRSASGQPGSASAPGANESPSGPAAAGGGGPHGLRCVVPTPPRPRRVSVLGAGAGAGSDGASGLGNSSGSNMRGAPTESLSWSDGNFQPVAIAGGVQDNDADANAGTNPQTPVAENATPKAPTTPQQQSQQSPMAMRGGGGLKQSQGGTATSTPRRRQSIQGQSPRELSRSRVGGSPMNASRSTPPRRRQTNALGTSTRHRGANDRGTSGAKSGNALSMSMSMSGRRRQGHGGGGASGHKHGVGDGDEGSDDGSESSEVDCLSVPDLSRPPPIPRWDILLGDSLYAPLYGLTQADATGQSKDREGVRAATARGRDGRRGAPPLDPAVEQMVRYYAPPERALGGRKKGGHTKASPPRFGFKTV